MGILYNWKLNVEVKLLCIHLNPLLPAAYPSCHRAKAGYTLSSSQFTSNVYFWMVGGSRGEHATPYRKLPGPESNPWPPRCQAAALTTVPSCPPLHNYFLGIFARTMGVTWRDVTLTQEVFFSLPSVSQTLSIAKSDRTHSVLRFLGFEPQRRACAILWHSHALTCSRLLGISKLRPPDYCMWVCFFC